MNFDKSILINWFLLFSGPADKFSIFFSIALFLLPVGAASAEPGGLAGGLDSCQRYSERINMVLAPDSSGLVDVTMAKGQCTLVMPSRVQLIAPVDLSDAEGIRIASQHPGPQKRGQDQPLQLLHPSPSVSVPAAVTSPRAGESESGWFQPSADIHMDAVPGFQGHNLITFSKRVSFAASVSIDRENIQPVLSGCWLSGLAFTGKQALHHLKGLVVSFADYAISGCSLDYLAGLDLSFLHASGQPKQSVKGGKSGGPKKGAPGKNGQHSGGRDLAQKSVGGEASGRGESSSSNGGGGKRPPGGSKKNGASASAAPDLTSEQLIEKLKELDSMRKAHRNKFNLKNAKVSLLIQAIKEGMERLTAAEQKDLKRTEEYKEVSDLLR